MWGDAVWVALIAGPMTMVLTHLLGQRDRTLASEAVKALNLQIETMKQTHAKELEERDAIISRQARQLAQNGITP